MSKRTAIRKKTLSKVIAIPTKNSWTCFTCDPPKECPICLESFTENDYKKGIGFYPKKAWKHYERQYREFYGGDDDSTDPCTLHEICMHCMFKLKNSRCPYCYKSLRWKRNHAINALESRQQEINRELRKQYLNFRHPGHDAYFACDCYKDCDGKCQGDFDVHGMTIGFPYYLHFDTDNEEQSYDESEEEDDY